jgi:hypothetical protein
MSVVVAVTEGEPEDVHRVICDETQEVYEVSGIGTAPADAYAKGLRFIGLRPLRGAFRLEVGMTLSGVPLADETA